MPKYSSISTETLQKICEAVTVELSLELHNLFDDKNHHILLELRKVFNGAQ